jgi:lipoprotein-releasing system ATP-binding protein
VEVLGTDLTRLSPTGRAAFRKDQLAYVFQFHHLLHELNLVENVALPLLIRGTRTPAALREAGEALASVGLGGLETRFPRELSGGEQQRGCLARALAARPRILLLDEPTGSLDQATADGVMRVFMDLHLKNSWTSIIVTHNVHVSRLCTRILRLGPPA